MSSEISQKFAQRLKQLRRQRNMSQEDLALAAGVDRSYIGRIENCKRSPGLDILWKLSKGLNITLNELLKF